VAATHSSTNFREHAIHACCRACLPETQIECFSINRHRSSCQAGYALIVHHLSDVANMTQASYRNPGPSQDDIRRPMGKIPSILKGKNQKGQCTFQPSQFSPASQTHQGKTTHLYQELLRAVSEPTHRN
jgi:hypothetical protein